MRAVLFCDSSKQQFQVIESRDMNESKKATNLSQPPFKIQ